MEFELNYMAYSTDNESLSVTICNLNIPVEVDYSGIWGYAGKNYCM